MIEARIEIDLEEGALDAFVACPDSPGRRAPILLLSDRHGVTPQVETWARRLSAHNYFVLAPVLTGRGADDRLEAAQAALDHLADERRVEDACVGVLGFGSGANLALRLAAARAERIAAVAALGGRGFGRRTALEIASRVNALVHLGYVVGHVSPRVGTLETALCEAGVDFDMQVTGAEPDWASLLDVFARALRRREAPAVSLAAVATPGIGP
jgi:carboxymethylenebutenolidase